MNEEILKMQNAKVILSQDESFKLLKTTRINMEKMIETMGEREMEEDERKR